MCGFNELSLMIRPLLKPAIWLLPFVSLAVCQADTASVSIVPADPALSIKLPPGFKINVFADLSQASTNASNNPRMMALDADGHLYVTLRQQGKVLMLPDRDQDGVADEIGTVAQNLNYPQGITFVNGQLLVANQDSVVSLPQKNHHWPAASVIPLIKNLPAGGHAAKSLKLGPDGFLYLNVGSTCNVCDESDPLRATLLRYTTTGQPAGALLTAGQHAQSPIWAAGLRSSQGFAWHPVTGEMFATNDGADMRANTKGGRANDELPPEHLNLIQAGKHYGWPYCWGSAEQISSKQDIGQQSIGQFADPNVGGSERFCKNTQAPEITFTAHSTPIGIVFLKGAKFPAEYQSDAIVALHGSWNRVEPSGYKLVLVKFKGNRPVQVEDFATGWLHDKSAWGRPVDIALSPDGELFLSDDRAGLIYRISYTKH